MEKGGRIGKKGKIDKKTLVLYFVEKEGKIMIYLDNAATTSVSQTVLDAMLPYMSDKFGNPSSIHSFGREVRKAVDKAREQVANAINAKPDEIYFTSGGSESDNLAVKGSAFASGRKKIVVSEIEHPAVLKSCEWLEKIGFSRTLIPVDHNGLVSLEEAETVIDGNTFLVSVMLANNEIGTIQPLNEISKIAKKHNVLVHTDAVQAVGAIPVDVDKLGVDMLSMSGHKLHAPKGIGALYIRKGVKIEQLIHGGGQEHGMRSGTENVAGIVGLGVAITEATKNMVSRTEHMNELKHVFFDFLKCTGIKYKINGAKDNYSRLPNNINISLPHATERNIPMRFDYNGIAVSSGSACSSGKAKPSHVLTAIGCTDSELKTSMRITLGDDTTTDDIIRVCKIISSFGGI